MIDTLEPRALFSGVQLTGTTFGTAGSFRGHGNTVARATDGDPSTYYDAAAANGGVVGVDLGVARVVAEVKFAPRGGWAQRMVGGVVQASNDAAFATGVAVDACIVAAAPEAGVLTAAVPATADAYRYWRYVGPAGSYCNLAELELFAPEVSTPTPTPDFTSLTWTTRASGPVWRSEALKANIGGRLYVFGGFGSKGPMLRSDVYTPATNAWARVADLPEELTHTGVAVDGTDVYFLGGYVGKGDGTFNQTFGTRHVWVYHTTTNTFTAGPPLPAAYAGGGAAVVNGTLHYFGGFALNRSDVNVHWTLDLADPAAAWTAAPLMPRSVNHMGAVVYGGRIYAIAGQTGHDAGLTTRRTVQVFDPATNVWSSGSDMPAARSHIASATFVMGDRILVMGGESANEVQAAQCYAYTPATDTWVTLTPLPTPRFSGVADVIDGRVYFTSGGNGKTTYQGTPVT